MDVLHVTIENGQHIDIISKEFDRIASFTGNLCPLKENILQNKDEAIAVLQFVIDYFQKTLKQDSINFMEIGTNRGGNFVLFGNVLAQIFQDVWGFALDMSEPDGYVYQKNMTAEQCIVNLKPQFQYSFYDGDSRKWQTIDAVRKVVRCDIRMLDLLYIDGGHDPFTSTHDFEFYTPMVKENGLVIIHDITNCRQGRGVYAWDKYRRKYGHWEFCACQKDYGIGVLQFTCK